MKREIRKIKTCVNCRHLEILEEGQVVHGLDDTAYLAFKCKIFNYSGKEVFKFPRTSEKIIIEKESDECPFWEEWLCKSKEKEESSGSSENETLEPSEY